MILSLISFPSKNQLSHENINTHLHHLIHDTKIECWCAPVVSRVYIYNATGLFQQSIFFSRHILFSTPFVSFEGIFVSHLFCLFIGIFREFSILFCRSFLLASFMARRCLDRNADQNRFLIALSDRWGKY